MYPRHSLETANKSMPREFHIMPEETVDLLDVVAVAGRGDGSTTPSEEPPAPKIEGLDPRTKVEQPTDPSSRNTYRVSCERHPYTYAHAMFGANFGESDDGGQDNEPPKPRTTPKRSSTRLQKKSKQ